MPYSSTSRRRFLQLAGFAMAATGLSPFALATSRQKHFPHGFRWGVGSAAAQVESRQNRGRSNWDVFIDQGGHIRDGSTNVRCTDFENRFTEDFELLAQAGITSFRFSFAWPRIQPDSTKLISPKGLDYYDRMIDRMLSLGIEPFATLFHWDMPVWAENFTQRDIAMHLADYTHILTQHFRDRIHLWALLNEPNSVAFAGYATGIHAPGLSSAQDTGAAIHHQNLSLAYMAQAARTNLLKTSTLTTTLGLAPVRPATGNSLNDITIVKFADDFWNRAFLDPLYGKGYPESILPLVEPYIQQHDLADIAINPTTLGINYYSRMYVREAPQVPVKFMPDLNGAPESRIRTEDYVVEPDGLLEILQRVHNEYHQPAIYLTETGFALKDSSILNGTIDDPLRQSYIKAYLNMAHEAIKSGVDLKGIYYWAATDNFEWSDGFSKKFGLIHIDPKTLNRTPKHSLFYYGQCAKANQII